MPSRTQNISQIVLTKPIPCQQGHKMYLNLCWTNHPHVSENRKYISTCVDQTYPMPAQHLCWTKCQWRHKMYLNLCWPNNSDASEDTKCNSTCVNQTPSIPARTQNVSQLVLTKHFPCQRGHKMHLNMCRPILSHASEDTKCISTCVD